MDLDAAGLWGGQPPALAHPPQRARRHPNIKLTEDGGAPPYDYTQAKDAENDLDYSPEQYEDFELLDPEDFLKP